MGTQPTSVNEDFKRAYYETNRKYVQGVAEAKLFRNIAEKAVSGVLKVSDQYEALLDRVVEDSLKVVKSQLHSKLSKDDMKRLQDHIMATRPLKVVRKQASQTHDNLKKLFPK